MNPYCNPLSLSIPPLREGYDVTQVTESHIRISLDEINPAIEKLLLDLGIKVSLIELFHREPGNKGTIHTDVQGGDFAKINWIYQGDCSHMLWFKVNDENSIKDVSTTVADTPYVEYSPHEVTLAHVVRLSGVALVQVGVPHLVVNPKEHRYCLCFVLKDATTGYRLTMQQSYDLLSKYII